MLSPHSEIYYNYERIALNHRAKLAYQYATEQKKNACFRYKALLEDIYYYAERNLDKNQIIRFADSSFIERAENILITTSTGSGKSYLAAA